MTVLKTLSLLETGLPSHKLVLFCINVEEFAMLSKSFLKGNPFHSIAAINFKINLP